MSKSKNGGLNLAKKLYRQTGSRNMARAIVLMEVGIEGEKALKLMQKLDQLDVHIILQYEGEGAEAEADLIKQIQTGAA